VVMDCVSALLVCYIVFDRNNHWWIGSTNCLCWWQHCAYTDWNWLHKSVNR